MSARELRVEMLGLLTDVRSAGRGAFRSALEEVFDRRLPGLVSAHDSFAEAVMTEGFRDRLQSAMAAECLRIRTGALPRTAPSRPRSWALGWGMAAAALILIALLVYNLLVPKRDYIAPKDEPGVTGPQRAAPKLEPPLRPKGRSVQKSPDVRIEVVPREREKERERVAVREPEPVVGRLVSGDPSVHDADGRPVSVKRGAELRRGTIIDAGDLGSVEILLKDGSRLTLGFNTVVVLRGENGREFELRSGLLYASVSRTEGLDKFLVETPVATAEVLGTEFGLTVQRKAKLQAVLQVKSGKVAFYNDLGSIEAGAMTESTAVEGAKPTPPRRISRLRTYTLYYGSNDFWLVNVDTSRLTLGVARNILVHPTGSTGIVMNGLPGEPLRAVEVIHGSAADRAGIKSGDVLLAINGTPTRSGRAGQRHLFQPIGNTIRVTVRRGAQQLDFAFMPSDTFPDIPKAPPKWAARLSLGTELLLKGDFDRSMGLLQDLAAVSGEAAAFNNLAVAHEVMDDMPGAIRGYKAAVERAPDEPLYHLNLGLALQKIENHPRSIEEMEEAVALNPKHHAAILFLARAYSLVDRVDDALRVLEAGARADPKCPHYDHARSITLMKAGRYAEAVDAAQRAVNIDPGLATMHAQLGRSLRMARRFPEAESAYKRAIELDPAAVVFLSDLGTLLTDMRRFDEAEAALRKALELDPNSANARNKLGLTFVRRERYPDAEREFREAIRLEPKGESYHNNLGGALLNQGRFKEAEEAFLKSIALAPDAPQTYAYMGTLFFRSQRFTEAEKWYRRAAELEPRQMAHTNMLVQILLRLNRPKDAVEARRTFLALNPDNFGGYQELSHILQQQERNQEAKEVILRAIERHPNSGIAYIDLGAVHMNLRQLPEAEAALRKGIELEPRNAIGYANLGGVLFDLGRFKEAEPMFQRAAELQPNNPQWRHELGMIMQKLNRLEEAVQMYAKAASVDPTNPEWPYQQARLLEKLNRPADAERMYRKAIEVKPGSHVGHDDLAHFLDRQGRVLEAVEAYRAAAERNLNDPGQSSEYGWSLIVVHRWEEALQAYRKCLEIDSKGDYILNTKCNLGFALIHLARLNEAEAILSEARKLKPDDAEARSNWAFLLAHQGRDFDEALRLAQATTQPDSHWQRFYVLGSVHFRRNEFDAAIPPLRKAADGFGKAFLAADALVILGQVFEAKKDVPAALAAYRRALQIEPGNKPAAEALKRLAG